GLVDMAGFAVLGGTSGDASVSVEQAAAPVLSDARSGLRFQDVEQVAGVVEHRAGAGAIFGSPAVIDHLSERLAEIGQRGSIVMSIEPGHTPDPCKDPGDGSPLSAKESVEQLADGSGAFGVEYGAKACLPWGVQGVWITGAKDVMMCSRRGFEVGVHRTALRSKRATCNSAWVWSAGQCLPCGDSAGWLAT